MMTFSSAEILYSMICALIYGVFFAALMSFLILIKGIVKESGNIFKKIIFFDKIFPLPRFRDMKIKQDAGAFLSVIFVLCYAVGFCLLSYFALDGELRIYMLVLSFASFYLSKFAFFEILTRIFLRIFHLIFTCCSLPVRAVILPARFLIRRLKLSASKLNAQK